jgi:ribosomal protein S18 acetylase RimI-like enzyme
MCRRLLRQSAGSTFASARPVTARTAKEYPVVTRDLTAPWTFAGGSEPEQVWLRLTTMSSVNPMPSYAETATPTERWHVANYVLSLARTPPWQPGGRLDGPGQHPDPLTRGEYLVHAEMCGLCGTQINPTGIYRGDDFYLAGGLRVGAYPQGVFVSRNLTGDSDTGLGRWNEAEIATAIREGRARGRVLNIWGMPWMQGSSFFVAESSGEVIGFAQFVRRSAESLELTRIYTLPAWQRRGVGMRLLDAWLTELAEEGLKHLTVEVERDNGNGRRFYELAGFAERRELTRDVQGYSFTLVEYRRPILGDC